MIQVYCSARNNGRRDQDGEGAISQHADNHKQASNNDQVCSEFTEQKLAG